MANFRIGIGYDAHKFIDSENNTIRICGLNIPYHRKIEGHSDADIVLHAVVDAILGAIGENDIGHHFPPSDMRFKNADSSIFIAKALELMRDKNFKISNVDVIIIAEEPKISPHRFEMRENLAKMLNMDTNRVNIKATTTEGMGFTGRKEGIAANAAVLVYV